MKQLYYLSKVFILILFGLALWSCSKDKDNLDSPEGAETPTRPVGTPDKITLFSDYNNRIEWHWPVLDKEVTSAQITYIEGGKNIHIQVQDFAHPTVITVRTLEEYDFTLVYINEKGFQSDPMLFKAKARPYTTRLVVDSLQVRPALEGVYFTFKQPLEDSLEYKIAYTYKGQYSEKILQTTQKELEVQFDNLVLPNVEAVFNIKVLNLRDKNIPAVDTTVIVNPLLDVFKFVPPTLTLKKEFNKIAATWQNITGQAVQITLQITQNGAMHTIRSEFGSTVNNLLDTILKEGTYQVSAFITDLQGKSSEPIFLEETITYKNFTSAAHKVGWTPYVSSSQQNDRAISMYDGTADNTFWYSNGNLPATINTTFTQTRGSSASGLFTENAFLSPAGPYDPIVVKAIRIKQRTNNINTSIRGIRLSGLDLSGNVVQLGMREVPNNIYNVNNGYYTIDLDNDIALRSIKLEVLSGWNNQIQTALAQLDVYGFIQ